MFMVLHVYRTYTIYMYTVCTIYINGIWFWPTLLMITTKVRWFLNFWWGSG